MQGQWSNTQFWLMNGKACVQCRVGKPSECMHAHAGQSFMNELINCYQKMSSSCWLAHVTLFEYRLHRDAMEVPRHLDMHCITSPELDFSLCKRAIHSHVPSCLKASLGYHLCEHYAWTLTELEKALGTICRLFIVAASNQLRHLCCDNSALEQISFSKTQQEM